MAAKQRNNVALDFDGTFTLNPKMWTKIVATLNEHGFDVWLVTMREAGGSEEAEVREVCKGANLAGFIFTDREAKKPFCEAYHPMLWFSFWIDDNPYWILKSAAR